MQIFWPGSKWLNATIASDWELEETAIRATFDFDAEKLGQYHNQRYLHNRQTRTSFFLRLFRQFSYFRGMFQSELNSWLNKHELNFNTE